MGGRSSTKAEGGMDRVSEREQRFYVATKNPKETLKAIYAAGRYKAALRIDVLALQTFMAGIYIGVAGHLSLSVGGGLVTMHEENPSLQKLLFAVVFPLGLIAVVLMGAELFTGDAFVFIAAALARRVTVLQLLRNWAAAWVGNYVGCIAWAYFMSYLTEIFADEPYQSYVVGIVEAKANTSWGVLVLKGVGANFLVCLSVWMATMAEDVTGKITAIFWPIFAFIVMGFEHSIADMYLSSVGLMYGADISVFRIVFKLIVPVTIGNIIGGGVFVGALYWYIYDKMARDVHAAGGMESYHSPDAPLKKERDRVRNGNGHGDGGGNSANDADGTAPVYGGSGHGNNGDGLTEELDLA